MDAPADRIPPEGGERLFNAPARVVLLAASMPLLFLFQQGLPDFGLRYALRPALLWLGDWTGLLTSMLLHGGWVHAGMNALGALAFGAPVARRFPGLAGVLVVFALYIVCGVIGGLGFALVHPGGYEAVIGASGAVFGLIGAATRLPASHERRSGVLPLLDRRVLSAAAAWMAVNLFTGLIGLAPGAGGGRIAWEAHAFGFAAGLLLIGPLVRRLGRDPASFDSPGGLSDPAA